jgi:hypothetical protein
MAVESKPLFHPEVIRQEAKAWNFPEKTRGMPFQRHSLALMI